LSGLSCDNNPKEYKIASWEKLPFVDGKLYWHMFNFTKDMGKHEQLLMVKDVFWRYSHRMAPLLIDGTEDPAKAYFRIYWIGKDGFARDEDGKAIFKSPYDFRKSTVAVCYPKYGDDEDGLLLINDEHYFSVKAAKGKIIAGKMLEHEIGHGVGMDHTNVSGDIMDRNYNPENIWTLDSGKGLFKLFQVDRLQHMRNDPEAMLLYEQIQKSKPLRLRVNDVDDRVWKIVLTMAGLLIGYLIG